MAKNEYVDKAVHKKRGSMEDRRRELKFCEDKTVEKQLESMEQRRMPLKLFEQQWNHGTRLTFDGTRGKKSKGDTDPGQILFVASSLPEDEILRPLRVLEKRLVRLLNKVLVLNKWPINGSGSIHKKKKYGQNPVMKQLLGRLRSTRRNTVMITCPNLVMSCLAT